MLVLILRTLLNNKAFISPYINSKYSFCLSTAYHAHLCRSRCSSLSIGIFPAILKEFATHCYQYIGTTENSMPVIWKYIGSSHRSLLYAVLLWTSLGFYLDAETISSSLNILENATHFDLRISPPQSLWLYSTLFVYISIPYFQPCYSYKII